MNFKWFYIINKNDFDATGLPSTSLDLQLEGIGAKTVLVTKGNYIGITYDDVFLALQMDDHDPFVFEDTAISMHENGDIFLGLLIDEN